MKKYFVFSIVLILAIAFSTDLTIYAYDSFVSYGLSAKVIPMFEKMYNCKVRVVTSGDAADVLSKLIFEKNHPKADIILGIDQSLLSKAKDAGVLIPYKPSTISNIENKDLIFDKDFYVTPYDYGAIAIIYDSTKIKNPPERLHDLAEEERNPKGEDWERGFIIEDPRTSSTGMMFFQYIYTIYGDDCINFWDNFKKNILTVTKGWDEAFSLFTQGEAPFMVSYATDPAYFYYTKKETKYKVLQLKNGFAVQIEGAGIVKGTKHLKLAKKFIDFMLTKSFQENIPLTQWMYPVINVPLPKCYKYAANINKIVNIDYNISPQKIEHWLKEWENVILEY